MVFLAVAVCFIVATAMSEYADWEIQSTADSLVGNSTPSMTELTMARTELRHLEVAIDDLVDLAGDHITGTERDEVAKELALFDEHWRAYTFLPTYAGER